MSAAPAGLMQPTDTGGLGLLQLLMQSGIVTPQHLLALLTAQQRPGGDDNIGGAGGAPGGPVGNTGATNSGPGTPGVGPTDGTTTGVGNMSLTQSLAAFGQGAANGLPGMALGNNIASAVNKGDVSLPQGLQMGLQGLQFAGQLAHGVNPASLGLNMGLRGLIGLASGAQASVGGPRGPTVSQALADMVSGLKEGGIRGFFGLQDPNNTPQFEVPNVPQEFNFELEPPDVTGNVPSGPAAAPDAPSDSGIGPGVGGNPGGGEGDD